MATLTVNTTTNFAGTVQNNVTKLQFGNTSGTANASFNASQFDGVQIVDNLAVAGSAGTNGIIVNNAIAFDASGWTFSNWSAADTITLNGTSLGDSIIGSSQADTINEQS